MSRNLFRLLSWVVVFTPIPAYSAPPQISPLANSHPDYLALRNAKLGQSFSVQELTLTRDVGVFRLLSGTVTLLEPVREKTVLAVFIGRGEFSLQPAVAMEADLIELHLDAREVKESFQQAVFCFTDDTDLEIRTAGATGSPGNAAEVLAKFRRQMRSRNERPRSGLEARLNGEQMDNIDADLLAGLLNPQRPKFFSAYMRGDRFQDLRFHLRPLGGVPQMLSPEEVALIHFDPRGDREGIWYLTHRKQELDGGTASSHEDKRVIDVQHYDIEAEIASNRDLSAEVGIDFLALREGSRVLRFGLLPSLRVAEVTFRGQPTHFIQSGKKEDAGFYVILPQALERQQQYRLQVRYAGDEVIRSEGGGNFAVGARTSWYPSIGSFRDRATYEMIFFHPRRYVLAAAGNPVEEGREGNKKFSRWKSQIPLKVAGFNYGDFKKMQVKDERTETVLEGFATAEVPDVLRSLRSAAGEGTLGEVVASFTPKRMMEGALVEGQGSTQLFTQWFGPLPFGRIAITQQPQFGFGQSWPMLVYLPISAFMDLTQRWAILGPNAFDFSNFVQIITPHEVAHQWWGHLVGWETYRDQWISEGFAEFSAGLYVQATRKEEEYIDFLRRWRETILAKNQYGYSANDAGPIWMGWRLDTRKTGSAYQKLIYPKGGFILHMLRQIMHDSQQGDQPFMEMMQDFVQTHHNKDASTESFKAVVEKHMTGAMDLDGNGRMDWFFNQWVYGTELPSYELNYSLTPVEGGKAQLEGSVSQSGISDDFKMMMPIYLRVQGKLARLGAASLFGTASSPFDVTLPWMPEQVVINAYHDVLAREISIQRQ